MRLKLVQPTPTTWSDYCAATVARWLGERCATGAAAAGCREETTRLFADFTAWCAGAGITPPSIAQFGRTLGAAGFRLAKSSTGRKMRWPIRLGAGAGGESKSNKGTALLPAGLSRREFNSLPADFRPLGVALPATAAERSVFTNEFPSPGAVTAPAGELFLTHQNSRPLARQGASNV